MNKILTTEAVEILRAQLGRPFTVSELRQATGAGPSTAFHHMRKLEAGGRAYIAHYGSGFGKPVAHWELGKGESATQPKPVTNSQKQAAKRGRKKWGNSPQAIQNKLNHKIQLLTARYNGEVARLREEAELAKSQLNYGRSASAKTIPEGVIAQTTLAAQIAAVSKEK